MSKTSYNQKYNQNLRFMYNTCQFVLNVFHSYSDERRTSLGQITACSERSTGSVVFVSFGIKLCLAVIITLEFSGVASDVGMLWNEFNIC